MAKKDVVSSDDKSSRARAKDKKKTEAGDDHKPISSENGLVDHGTSFDDAEESEDLVEDGFDIATHGGGRLENVAGFELARAMTEGFESEDLEVSDDLENAPRSCDLAYEVQESVCGRDDRVRINTTSGVPWRMICQLIITTGDNRTSRCTGWFIGPRTVMTAGHCVFSHRAGGWAERIQVIPGMDANQRPFGSATGTSFRTVRAWVRDRSPEHDYGAIILPNNRLGSRVGWFGFAALSDRALRNLLINNSGYAGDQAFGTQWYNAGRITRPEPLRLQYMIDTAGGHSGSPTWRHRNGQRHAVGIHAYGGCPNKSTRITRSVYDNMKRWKNLGS